MTGSIRPLSTFQRSGNYVVRRIAGETIVVPMRAQAADLDSVYVLNDVGGTIWELLETDRSAEEIVRVIAAEFDVTVAAAGADVERFLAMLSGAGLIERRERA
jgi:MinD-like ATPase involved in chromosome partitioning or flagellar assembly